MKQRETTIYDIAERLGLAASTISRGLKGHHTVSQQTQRRIIATAEAMGYRSNSIAASLRTNSTQTIGVIVPRLDSYLMSQIIAGMEKVTSEAGYNLLISQSREMAANEARSVQSMLNSRVDALLVSLAEHTDDLAHFEACRAKGVPLVFFDRVPADMDQLCITINNEMAGYQATRHLLDQGARQIMFISGSLRRNVYEQRLAGYKRALTSAKIKFNPEHIIINDLTEEAGIRAARAVVSQHADGVVVTNDICAAACMNEVQRLGRRVPQQVKFTGFNNDIISRQVTPALTTINYPGIEMGEVAARHVLAHLKGNVDISQLENIVIKSSLIIRESSL
ncbi:transcriptional regulator, LacI family [Chitinophaga jiangningensis]|uniref:Transcriptional regulator, LacI family n=1 Tax=Chitinophaga jiangningensis TaxID=1419482 RepID=A0A1M6XT18_9BACT|nr:LacI family DNA-binding transcriptional regulator [Chitinophaga jiangningensis]SHL09137.1 transcriptional regulator, LacI family [Chitinophaga jiangningensis]